MPHGDGRCMVPDLEHDVKNMANLRKFYLDVIILTNSKAKKTNNEWAHLKIIDLQKMYIRRFDLI